MRFGLWLVVFAACRTPSPAAPDESSAVGYLVWRTTDRTSETQWFDGDGVVRGRANGIYIATDDGLWRVALATTQSPTTGCELVGDGGEVTAGTADLTELTLESVDGASRLVVERLDPTVAAETATFSQSLSVRASLGSRLFIEEFVDVYACGAHGSLNAKAFGYDIATRSRLDHGDHPAPGRLQAVIAAAATDADGGGLAGDSIWRIGEQVPTWSTGALMARDLVYIDACYACSSGDWSSYTWATWIPDVRIPDDWQRGGDLPAMVVTSLQAAGDQPAGVSWATVDAGWSAVFAGS
jgi:hypothetical protein